MPTTMFCGHGKGWVRGNASLDPSSGILNMTVQLETDTPLSGPKGYITATLKYASGKTLATAKSKTIGTGGKKPGRAAKRNFSSQKTINKDIAAQVKSIYLEANCDGHLDRLFDVNIDIDKLKDTFEIAVAIGAL